MHVIRIEKQLLIFSDTMASPLPPDQLKNLKLFIEFCKKEPNILHHPDLVFFKNYIESLGGVISPKHEEKGDTKKAEANVESEELPVESDESEVELDYEGVIGKILFPSFLFILFFWQGSKLKLVFYLILIFFQRLMVKS